MTNQYRNLQDFMMDPLFNEWINGSDPEVDTYWRTWIAENPDKADLVKQAQKILHDLKNQEDALSKDEKAILWANITAGRAAKVQPENKSNARPANVIKLYHWSVFTKVAASLAAILVLGIVLFWALSGNQQLVKYATTYGEVKNITLPDGSEVVLNANSTLRFEEEWDNNEDREVYLDGEAYFSVIHKLNNQKFNVRLSDNLKVEVLGTKFTATQRFRKTRVVLNEGKVKMVLSEDKLLGLTSAAKVEATLAPGELFEVNNKLGSFDKRPVNNPEMYADFRYHRVSFNDASLAEVARVLEDTHGYKVTFAKPDLADKRFTGTVPVNQIEMLFLSIEKLFHVNIIREGKQLIIK